MEVAASALVWRISRLVLWYDAMRLALRAGRGGAACLALGLRLAAGAARWAARQAVGVGAGGAGYGAGQGQGLGMGVGRQRRSAPLVGRIWLGRALTFVRQCGANGRPTGGRQGTGSGATGSGGRAARKATPMPAAGQGRAAGHVASGGRILPVKNGVIDVAELVPNRTNRTFQLDCFRVAP